MSEKSTLFTLGILEWQSHSEVEGKITIEVVMEDGVVVTPFVSRVDGFHTCIEANDEKVGIHAKTNAITHSNLLPESAKAECTSRLVFVSTDGPYITCIDEGGTTEFPKELGTVFKAQIRPNERTDHPRTLLAPPAK